MTDEMLSQDEIDALLKITEDGSDDASDETDVSSDQTADSEEPSTEVSDYLSDIEVDTIGEIGNISFGSAATTLSTLLNQKVDITTPRVSIMRRSDLNKAFPFKHVGVQVSYVEGFTGTNLLVIKSDDAAIISDIMLGGDGSNPDPELNEIHLSAVQEAMNQMMGAAATSMSTIFNKFVNISPPTIELFEEEQAEEMVKAAVDNEEVFVKVSFQLKVGDLIDSSIMQLIPFPFAHELVEELMNGPQSAEDTTSVDEPQQDVPQEQESLHKEEAAAAAVALEQPTMQRTVKNESPQLLGETHQMSHQPTVQPASFSSFEPVQLAEHEQRNLDMLLDIPLRVTVELGRTKQTIKSILDLSKGSIVELDKLAGEPVDILVNDKLIAKGEVVVIDENFGVRVTEIISQSERIKQLK